MGRCICSGSMVRYQKGAFWAKVAYGFVTKKSSHNFTSKSIAVLGLGFFSPFLNKTYILDIS